MRRHILFILTVLLAGFANGQKLFDMGLKAGFSRDNISLENVADHTAILGWHAGMFARVKPPLAPGVQVELLYTTMGTDARPADSIPGSSSIRLNYAQLPLFLVFSLGPAELHVGGYGSYLLNSSIRQPAAIHDEFVDLRENQFQEVDYGLLGGLGLRLGRFYTGARYTVGLGTLGSSDNDILRNARNLQAQFYIGLGLVR